jgi:RNA polymerase sigma-70 factor (ECF subfamily)
MIDARAYERALRPLLGQAGAYARAMLRSRTEAEDAVQQAALKGWERIGQYDATRPFKGWWFAILRNGCLDALRRAKAFRTVGLEGVDPPTPCEPEIFDWRRLVDGLAQLSEPHREILQLKYFAELSYDDIAETLAIPKGTVMSRLHLARKALAARIGKEQS